MAQAHLKSSFIYLANAVNDLRDNRRLLAIVLAPLVFAISCCFLPDALNLQYQLAARFEPGLHSVALEQAQVPYQQNVTARPPRFPGWLTGSLHIVALLIGLFGNLVILCTLARMYSNTERTNQLQDAIAIYTSAVYAVPSFWWVMVLEGLIAFAVGLMQVVPVAILGIVLLLVVFPGLLIFVWLYVTQYAMVVEKRPSLLALQHTRDITKGRFFKVAMRVVVFLAVLSGYGTWASIILLAIDFVIGFAGALTGLLWFGVFLAEIMAFGVASVTTLFFYAAGIRLYRDLNAGFEQAVVGRSAELPPTGPLAASSAI